MKRYIPQLVVFAIVALVYLFGGLDRFEHLLMDLRFRLTPQAASERIVVVEIDERSLRLLNVWPWPRSYHAQLIDRLADAGARIIAMDIDFSSHSTPENDAELVAALKRAGGRVVLPVFKQHTSLQRDASSLAETGPLPKFAEHARLGSVVVRPESDSMVRRAVPSLFWGEQEIPSFPVLLAGDAGSAAGMFYVDFGIRPETIPRISYVDVLRGEFPPRMFEGRSVLIGASAIELGDQLPVPLQVTMPGPFFLALSAETLGQGRALLRTGPLPTLLVTFLLAILLGRRLADWTWHRGLLVLSGGTVGLFGISAGLQAGLPVSLDVIPWLLAPWLCYGQSMIALIDRQALRIFRQRMAVQHRRAMMRRFVESSFDGIVVIDIAGEVSLFNQAAEAMLGYRAEEIVGQSCDHLFDFSEQNGDPEDNQHIADDQPEPFKISDLLDLETTVPAMREGLGLRRDGSTFVMEMSIRRAMLQISRHPLERRSTPRTYHFLTIRDVTQRRLLEDTQRMAAEEAVAANRAKSEFLAAISHELRTPLNAIIGFSEMIKDEMFGPVGNEQYKNYSSDIYSSGRHLLAIINDILDIAKIEAGRAELEEDLVNIDHAVEAVLLLIGSRPEAEGLTLDRQVPEDLPPLIADAKAMKQILLNLVSNAVKFTEEGSVVVAARLEDDGGLAIAVTDTGIGIARDEIENLAQPFHQVDSSLARKFEGTGLGLALSKSLMELHDGRLVIESVQGEGTIVTCHFPASRVEPGTEGRNAVA
ncbi:MAG: CHASE2 domain-containing protein [Alphaproteobacteria bacterium]|jgi:PAS domain S-box-containing protein|nr:CHASE2 domain-containing protein [Alphaproteobacteria bacterium]